jgi:ABC-type multidrug transport system fused ATPase/permease subunit
MLIEILLASAGPYLLGRAVDAGVRARDAAAVGRIAALFFAAQAASAALGYAVNYLLAIVEQRVMIGLRMEIYSRVVYQSMAFFGREPVGRLLTRVMNDVQSIADLFSTGVIAILHDLAAIAIVTAILLALDARLATILLAVVPPLALAMSILNRRIRGSFRELRKLLARINAYLAECLSGIRVIQVFGYEEPAFRRFHGLNRAHLETQLGSVHYHALYATIVTVLTSGTIAALLWVGGSAALRGAVEVGVLVSFVGYAQQLFNPVRDLADKYAIFQSAMASAERIFQVLDAPVSVINPERPEPLGPIRGEIELRDVSFRYEPEAPWALRHVSLRVRPGERVAIVGHTGAGKSTIVNLVTRFYDVTEGAVLVDGRDVRSVDKRELRRQIGVVLQEPFVFAASVLENIRLLDPRISEEDARRAARAVGAESWILRLPKGYEEPLRERGATLSTGEKQLLSFARALAFDPRVLVLDEATASVDPETEARLQEAVRTLIRGRTSIIIAHRLGTIRDVDRVLVFHRGELREEGSVPDLLARKGLFHALYRLQHPEKGG